MPSLRRRQERLWKLLQAYVECDMGESAHLVDVALTCFVPQPGGAGQIATSLLSLVPDDMQWPMRHETLPTACRVAIVLSCAAMPVRGKQLARWAGCNADKAFRRVLRTMVRSGFLKKIEGGGYWLAYRERPATEEEMSGHDF